MNLKNLIEILTSIDEEYPTLDTEVFIESTELDDEGELQILEIEQVKFFLNKQENGGMFLLSLEEPSEDRMIQAEIESMVTGADFVKFEIPPEQEEEDE